MHLLPNHLCPGLGTEFPYYNLTLVVRVERMSYTAKLIMYYVIEKFLEADF